jgi:hypothetical protein
MVENGTVTGILLCFLGVEGFVLMAVLKLMQQLCIEIAQEVNQQKRGYSSYSKGMPTICEIFFQYNGNKKPDLQKYSFFFTSL